jgi:hypothetical protein
MTASIEAFLDDRCILRTGGQVKITGSHTASFADGGSEHQAVLSWGRVRRHGFPYQLQIDGVIVEVGQVGVENWRMGYVPVVLIVALVALLFMFLI